MDPVKKLAVLEWMKSMVQDVEITDFSELKDNSTIILQLLSKIDPLIQYPISTNEKNISWVCNYLKDFFNPDVIDEHKVQLGSELEIGKLLCLILELTLTSSENSDYISRIQCLPENIQTNIMSMTKMVCDHSQKFNLGEIMEKKLRLSINDESSILESDVEESALNVVPPGQTSTPLFESPQLQRKGLDYSLSENTSPLAVFASSPQALYRRVMVENKKLKQKVRHSELFMRRQNEFEEQLTEVVESEKIEFMEKNKSLIKEQENLLQKNKDLDDIINKLKEEIEFLQLETQEKDKEIADQASEMKKSHEIVAEVQTMLDKLSEAEGDLKHQKSLYEEEAKKNSSFKLKITELEHHNNDMKSEMLNTKQALESITKEMEQRKKDHSDQLAHLQEELMKWERQSMTQTTKNHETLSDALRRDEEILSLKEQVKKLENTIKVQETTIVNMGYDSNSIQSKKNELETENAALKEEIESLKKKSDESTENYKTQSNQYMDQISTLLKQVAEHSQRNEGLNAKMTSAEEKCKLLEKQIEKCEQSETKINEKIQKQNSTLQEKDEKILAVQKKLEERKASMVVQDIEKVKMEAKIQILTEDRTRLQDIEKQHQSLIYENERLKGVEKESASLATRVEQLLDVEKLHKEALVKLESLEASLSALKQENKQIDRLQGEVKSLKMHTNQVELSKKSLEESLSKHEEEKKHVDEISMQLKQENESLKVTEAKFVELHTECESMKKTLEDYKKASTNIEISEQNLMKEIGELRLIEAKYNTLLESEIALQETVTKLESTIAQNTSDVEALKKDKEETEAELVSIKEAFDGVEQEKKHAENKWSELNDQLVSIKDKYSALEQDIMVKQSDAAGFRVQLQESHTKVERLEEQLSEVIGFREKEREEARLQREKLNELREVEINYKIVLSENAALKSVSENLKNLSFALEKSEQNCQSLRANIGDLDQIRIQNTELHCHNRSLEAGIKEGLNKREKLTNEIVELKGVIENMKLQAEMSDKELQKSHEEEKAKLLEQFYSKTEAFEKINKENSNLQMNLAELTQSKEELLKCKQDLQQQVADLTKEKQDIQSEMRTQNSSQADGEVANERVQILEKDFEEKLKAQEEAFETNLEKGNETVNDLVLKIEGWKDAYARKEEEVHSYETLNREILDELKAKDRMIEKLEDKCVSGQVEHKRSTALARSYEMQLKTSNEVIIKLKKEVKELESLQEFGTSTAKRSVREGRIQPEQQNLDSSEERVPASMLSRSEQSDIDSGPLHESHLEPAMKFENKAEEIFQRSRSTRSKLRRSLIVMPTTREEETTDDDSAEFVKTYSLRQRADRRRSFQPRRYLGGHTPPSKRTLVGDPAQVQISTFNTENAEEPEIDYDWGRLESLSEISKLSTTNELSEEDRLKELQRRNTLCLPHLKSSYPMEISVNKENNVPEHLVKDSRGKRKGEDERPRGTYKKWKTENMLGISNDLSYLGRSTRSESSLRRETFTVAQTAKPEPVKPTPVQQSCAFEITMEPPKKMRGKFPRSVASGNLKGDGGSGVGGETNVLTEKPVTRNAKANRPSSLKGVSESAKTTNSKAAARVGRFHRGDGVRSSFKTATQKVAASFRGKKTSK